VAAAAAVVDAAVEAAEAAEECAQVAARAVAADTGLRPDALLPCRGQARDPLLGHPATGRVRDQAAVSGLVDQIARRWATCRRPAHGQVPHVPAALDPVLVAERATSPIDRAALDLGPAVDQATLPVAARGPALADVLVAVVHQPAILETSSIWVGPVAVRPVCGLEPQRPAARSQVARQRPS
jgi:hypothetical protein